MTDLAQLGVSIDAKSILAGLETVDKALAKTATAAEALATKIKTATGQMAAAFTKVKDGGVEKQAASIEKMNFAIEHQAKAYRALLAVMREDSAIAKSSAAQRILLNSAFASATAEINKATVAGAKNLAGLRSETAVTTSLAVAQGGLTESEKRLLDAKTRKNLVVKAHVDAVRAEIAASVKQVPMADAHVAALQREQAAIAAVTAALAKQRVEQERRGGGIVAMQRRQNASMGLSAAPKDLFAPFATDPKVVAVSNARTEALKREEAATRSLTGAEAARAKQAMSMRMEPILSTGSSNLPTRANSAFNAPAAGGVTSSGITSSGIASVDKMRESLASLKVEEAALRAGYSAGKVTHREYARGMDEITKSTNLAVAGNTRARGVFRRTASAIASATFEITGAVFGLVAAANILAGPAILGFKLQSNLEQVQVGMSLILRTMWEINGAVIQVPRAMEMAAGMTEKIQDDALKFGLSIDALAHTTQAILAVGGAAKLTIPQIQDLAAKGTIMVKAFKLPPTQAVQEIRDLIAGGIQPASSTVANAIGVNDKLIKQWREAGTLATELGKRFEGATEAAVLNAKTLAGAWEIFKTKVSQAFVNSEAFDHFKQKLIDLSNWLGKTDVNTGKFKFNKDLTDSITAYYEGFKLVVDVVSELGKLLSALAPVFQVLSVLLVNVVFVVRMIIGEIKLAAAQLEAFSRLDFKGVKLLGDEWKREATAARVEVDRLSAALLGVKPAADAAALSLAGVFKKMPLTRPGAKLTADDISFLTKTTPEEDLARATARKVGTPEADKGGSRAVDPQIAFMANLKKEVAILGMSEEAIQRYEIALMKLSPANLKLAKELTVKKFAFKALVEAAKEANEESDRANSKENDRIKTLQDATEALRKSVEQQEFEVTLIGLSNGAREEAIRLNEALTAGIDTQSTAYQKLNARQKESYQALFGFNNLKSRLGESTGIISTTEQSLQSQVVTGLISETEARTKLRDVIGEQGAALQNELLPQLQAIMATTTDQAKLAGMQQMIDKIRELVTIGNQKGAFAGFEQGVKDFANSAADSFQTVRDATAKAFKGMEDALVDFVMTGKLNFKDLAGSIIKDLIRIQIQQSLTPILSGLGKAAVGIIGGLIGGATTGAVSQSSYLSGNSYAAAVADGGVFSGGGLTAFAKGGILGPMGGMLTKPTVFPMANGMGLAGEAGPEAVMPLKRGPDGKLGVASSGGGGGGAVAVSITINDNRTQTETKGKGDDRSQAPKIAEMIKGVVHAKLVQEMRPGGLLA